MKNIESYIDDLAAEHDRHLRDLLSEWNKYHNAIANTRTAWKHKIKFALNAEAASRVRLYNAIAKSPASLWEKTKSRVHGLIKFGWRKKVGKILCADEPSSINRLFNICTADEYEQVVTIRYSLNRRGVRQLPANTLARAGIEITADSEEPFVSDAGDASKLLAALRADGWMDEEQ